ncbi:MAG TPA: HDOD domain-containing protein [Burkholderiaceae bacterium]|nr:HDOD domain-containing protein [Burkholderiaceae bacterium]
MLARTSEALDALRAVEDEVDANNLGEMISGDPLMTLKLLAFVAANRSRRTVTDTETVTAALVMIGIPPFFRAFGPQPTVEDRLADMPQALAGLSDALLRAHRAATFALGFAVHRMDPDVALIHNAALLHDFAEMLLWCHAPTLALQIRQAQLDDPQLRSSVAQRQVLNVELADLQQALMKAWRLPELLIRISDDRHADQTNVKCVSLALRLARHTAQDWDNPAIPDDVNEISQLLNLSQAATLTLLRDI